MYIFWLILILLGVTSCNTTQNNGDVFVQSGNIVDSDSLLRIVPPMEKGYLSFDSIVESVKYVPLATSDSVLISSISDVKVLDNIFYVADFRKGRIFAFNNSGDYAGKIDALGEGPDQYKRISSFDIDKKNKLLYLLDSDLGKVHVYDKSLHLNGVIKLPYKFVDHISLYNEHTFFLEFGFREYSKNDTSPNLVLYDFKNEKVVAAYFYYRNGAVHYRNQSPVAFSSYNNKLYYWTTLGNSIYECNDTILRKVVECDFGVYNTPSDIYLEKISVASSLMKKNHYACVNRFYEFSDWYYVAIGRIGSSAHYFYNKKKDKGFLDISFMNMKNKTKCIMPELFPVSESMCCGYITSEQYLTLVDEATMNSMSIEDNPILVFYKLKK